MDHAPPLSLLKITPSPQSRDYVENKRQFQLHGLLTEQRHPKTWGLNLLIGVVGLVLMLVFLNLSFVGRERDWYNRWIDAGGFLAAVSLLLLFACFEYW